MLFAILYPVPPLRYAAEDHLLGLVERRVEGVGGGCEIVAVVRDIGAITNIEEFFDKKFFMYCLYWVYMKL